MYRYLWDCLLCFSLVFEVTLLHTIIAMLTTSRRQFSGHIRSTCEVLRQAHLGRWSIYNPGLFSTRGCASSIFSLMSRKQYQLRVSRHCCEEHLDSISVQSEMMANQDSEAFLITIWILSGGSYKIARRYLGASREQARIIRVRLGEVQLRHSNSIEYDPPSHFIKNTK